MKDKGTSTTYRTQKAASTRSATKSASFHIPRGKTIHVVTKRAAGQVIREYGETLRKLEKH